jgi:hypothetical protein
MFPHQNAIHRVCITPEVLKQLTVLALSSLHILFISEAISKEREVSIIFYETKSLFPQTLPELLISFFHNIPSILIVSERKIIL